MHKFRELKVWQRAMGFVTEIYRVSRRHRRFLMKPTKSRPWSSVSLKASS